ncbi:hypothetical protein CTAYLR_001223 [Chrysophaeum taylorii]|uniref:SAM domain-containing protein n=1 Tax=Chrysophaeum taylorii TaxID=2483200 RepID=A0AAD7XL69_9STRA|nr:hypothetical protein CTAYLR_001223 [Chrysophaeum taylorii]
MTTQVIESPWAFASLHNVQVKERCAATIADTILTIGDDVVWLFTSKSGEVMRKRTVDVSNIRDRFCRLGTLLKGSSKNKFICRLRYANRGGALLGLERFSSRVLGEWPPTSRNLVAIQCFVPGAMYRNSYSKAEDGERIITSTHVMSSASTRPTSRGGGENASSTDEVEFTAINIRNCPISRATRLNEMLNAATLSIVRFLERTQHVRVLSLDADYVIDERNQLWLLWLGDTKVMSLPTKVSRSPTYDVFSSSEMPFGPSEQHAVSEQIAEAATRIESPNGPGLLAHKTPKTDEVSDERWPVQRNLSRQGRKKSGYKRFPSQWECAGDYCNFVVLDPKQLFAQSEIAALSKSNTAVLTDLIRDATRVHSAERKRDLVVVSYKSVALARKEKRGILPSTVSISKTASTESWMEYPETPRNVLREQQRKDSPYDDSTASNERRERRKKKSQRSASLSGQREKRVLAETSRTEIEGGSHLDVSPANYYRSVKVCNNCFSIYALLDKARDLLRNVNMRPLDSSARELRSSPTPPARSPDIDVEKEREDTQPRVLSDEGEDSDSGTVITALTRADGAQAEKSIPHQRPRASWKTRISETRLHGESVPEDKQETKSRFNELDEYLRGKSDAAARRVEAKTAAVTRSRAAQAHIAKAAGHDAAGMYFGRILLVDSRDSKALQDAVSILESAGFLVDVELDGRNARERLMEEFVATRAGWQLDAVLVSDEIELGDAFDVVKEVRAIERAHIARETKRVEEKAKEAAMQPCRKLNEERDLVAQVAFFQHLPVVIMTSQTSSGDLRAYKQSGMDGCVSKPLSRTALLSTMRAAVPRHGRTVDIDPRAKNPHKRQDRPQGETARQGNKHHRREEVVCVNFSVHLHELAASSIPKSGFDVGGFVSETANQLGVEGSRVEVVSIDVPRIGVQVTGFPDDEAGRVFLRALRARTQLVDEQRWGRNALEDLWMVGVDGQVSHGEAPTGTRALVGGAFGTAGSISSSAMAAKSLSLPASFTSAGGTVGGILQLDADTSLPYTVIDFSLDDQGIRQRVVDTNTFNLVVCHDFFDTLERMKIVLAPIAAKYPGLQILLWNYPGQAFTEWRDEQILNNVFLAHCLNELITQVGSRGTRQFDDQCPFFLLGYGYGGSVASFYVTHYRSSNVRGLFLFNGFSFVDPHLAGALHDAMNVFACAPPTRPDLPVYFWTRFLFSREYLMKVSTPLALNLYTAVHNPITLKGRMKLCVGGLSSRDVRPALKDLGLPIIAVQATEGVLVKPLHAQPWVHFDRVGGGHLSRAACPTIYQALKQRGTCIVWVKSGHEVFQEIRKQVSTLIEQIVLGYHELNDVAFIPADYADGNKGTGGSGGDENGQPSKTGHGNFEDNFINNILGKVRATKQIATTSHSCSGPGDDEDVHHNDGDESAVASWDAFQAETTRKQKDDRSPHRSRGRGHVVNTGKQRRHEEAELKTVLDPEMPAFERQDNVVYATGQGSRIYPTPADYPEVKEYMGWRLKRNRKRLQRLDFAARLIQNAFRNHLSQVVFQRLRREHAISFIQRAWRGWKGRQRFLAQMRRVWAAHVIQRAWRGYAGRGFFLLLRSMHAAAGQIQRFSRGFLARSLVSRMQRRRRRASTMVQTLVRRWFSRQAVFELRAQAIAARTVERVYRGHLGRRRAQNERNKYLFSKSQSQGIEFGRQMLLEHKLHATRLQSEVSLLTREKVQTEEAVEALLEEISEFEQGVNQLEKEMHQLSKIESEAIGVLDEEAKYELREQKMRLDKEFGMMLAKIAERRDRLSGLEGKLSTLDHARQGKEEKLRTLERKLVVLLEEQQRELEKIKRRQEARDDVLIQAGDAANSGAIVISKPRGSSLGENDSTLAFSGPTDKEKRQAAQLMQSTETLMKFGFMSMSMTYFSSLNMIKAMRTVAVQDTVMSALHAKNSMLSNGADGTMTAISSNASYNDKLGGEPFKPDLKPGQMPGQEALKVSAWSVEDVARWLQTLSLGQYREAFIDAAVDGAFLYDLDDDDLRNTLGIEHRLHRKKILNMTNKLRTAELERNKQMRIMANASAGAVGVPTPLDNYMSPLPQEAAAGTRPSTALVPAGGGGGGGTAAEGDDAQPKPPNDADEVFSLVRHGKIKKLKEALRALPARRFDSSLVKVAYVEDFGTAYVDSYEREHFNLNKVDAHGNSMLVVAAQNGNIQIAKLLVAKGANPNHQNKMGQTAGHYANAYQCRQCPVPSPPILAHTRAFPGSTILWGGSSIPRAAVPTIRSRTCTALACTTVSQQKSRRTQQSSLVPTC